MAETKTQHGYLILADISGYTSFLAGTELEHAHEILAELLEEIVGRFQSLLTISKLEGDAVFAYVPEERVPRGETLLELIESTYVAFRERVEVVHRRTTCLCNACRAIPTLDLKFMTHHGDYILQRVSTITELVGSDVNLVHRLMKNHVAEATGWHAYALFTESGLNHLGLRPEGGHEQTESYEHLGEVKTYSLDMRKRYQELMGARRVFVSAEEAQLVITQVCPAPPPIVWDWLNDPHKRAQVAFQEVEFQPILRPGGRTGVGGRNHCVHGKDVAMVENILDWKPFDYFTVEQVYMGLHIHITCQLEPLADGQTRVHVHIKGRTPLPHFLDRPIIVFMHTKIFPVRKMYEKAARLIEEAGGTEQIADGG
jgi:hypothetical protein